MASEFERGVQMQIRSRLSHVVFPVIFSGTLVSAWWAMTAGFHGSLVVFLVSISAGLTVTLLECWLPYEPQWSQSHSEGTMPQTRADGIS